jgi:gliding motility-associated-like protein
VMRYKHTIVLSVLCLLFLKTPIFSQNLLQNGDCEMPNTPLGIPFWSFVIGANWQPRAADPLPQNGNFYFYAGEGRNAELAQTIDVSNYSCNIDLGKQVFEFTGYIRSYPQQPLDFSRIAIEMINNMNTILITYDSGTRSNATAWEKITLRMPAPEQTRRIRIRLISTRNFGVDNDGFYDNLSIVPLNPVTNMKLDTVLVTDNKCGELNSTVRPKVNGGTGKYQYTIAGSTTRDSIIRNIRGGNYRLTIADSNGCTIATNVNIQDNPALILENVASNPPNCNKNNGTINIKASGGGGTLRYSVDSLFFTTNADFQNLGIGNFKAVVKDTAGCVKSQNLSLERISPPVIDSITPLSKDCKNSVLNLNIKARSTSGTLQYSLSDAATRTNFINNNLFENVKTGTYWISIRDIAGCIIQKNYVLNGIPPIVFESVRTTPSVCTKDDGTISIKADGGAGDLQFSIDSLNYQGENSFVNVKSGKYTVYAKDARECKNMSQAIVSSDCGIYLPNTFSPNNDGTNDMFTVYGEPSAIDKVVSFRIFNRWGSMVFDSEQIEINNPKTGWDGTFRSQILETGVYIYHIKVKMINGKMIEKSGDLTLVR